MWMNIAMKVSTFLLSLKIIICSLIHVDEVVDGKNDVVNPEGSIEDLSFASVESKSDTESLPLLLEEKPVPENTIDVQSDRHPKVQSMFLELTTIYYVYMHPLQMLRCLI